MKNRFNFVVQSSQSASRPVISLEPIQRSKRIPSIDQWVTAFETFVVVYNVHFSNEAPALIKYSETVRDLAAKIAHWRHCDENFRFLRQKNGFPLGPNSLGVVVAGAPHVSKYAI